MSHLKRLGDRISVEIPCDEKGYIGRKCPECKGYFKITPGTGLKDAAMCYCPYCGHEEDHASFATEAQIKYATSIAVRRVKEALHQDLKAMEFEHKPRGRGLFDIGISVKVKEGAPHPVHYYVEESLETEIVCDSCALRYAVFGVFAVCPDCGVHNSYQILCKNLELSEKELNLAATAAEADLAEYLIADALENVVSAFDGFGREVCRVYASKSSNPSRAERISFQNLEGAQRSVQDLFAADLAAGLTPAEWRFISQRFQKRHLIAHRMGVVDADYVTATNDPHAVVGHKITVTSQEVTDLVRIVKKLGQHLSKEVSQRPSAT